MILCATNLSFLKLNFKDFITRIHKIGFSNVEIAPYLISKDPFEKKNMILIKKILNHNKINIIALQSVFYGLNDLNFSNTYNTKYYIDHFNKVIKFANFFSIKKISIGSCPSRKYLLDKDLLWKINFDLFKKFAEIAIKSKIILCIEPINQKYGNNFLNNVDETVNFILKTNKQNIKLLLDTGNLEEEKIDFSNFVLKNKDYIHHIHISNKNLKNFNIKSIYTYIKLLKKVNYKESLSIEYLATKGNKLEKIYELIKTV